VRVRARARLAGPLRYYDVESNSLAGVGVQRSRRDRAQIDLREERERSKLQC
jgi:hypothetical protein